MISKLELFSWKKWIILHSLFNCGAVYWCSSLVGDHYPPTPPRMVVSTAVRTSVDFGPVSVIGPPTLWTVFKYKDPDSVRPGSTADKSEEIKTSQFQCWCQLHSPEEVGDQPRSQGDIIRILLHTGLPQLRPVLTGLKTRLETTVLVWQQR